MRRLGYVSGCYLALFGLVLIGCGQKAPQPQVARADSTTDRGSSAGLPRAIAPRIGGSGQTGETPVSNPFPGAIEAEREDKYTAALAEAMEHMSDHKWEEALAALEVAKGYQETETVRVTIARIKSRIDLEQGAEKTAGDIQAVLDDGRAEEAAKLAGEALRQYPETNATEKLARLKRQADALANVGSSDVAAKVTRFKKEADDALEDKQLRPAVIALEQAVAASADDATLKQKLDETRDALAKYDGFRSRAAELRRDPHQLEEAIESLREALKVWDNLGVRQELDEYQVALQSRKDRLAVAPFEVRGDVGIPAGGDFVADELLPAFKSKYDLVERGNLVRIAEELKLDDDYADDDAARKEIGRVSKIRYLVVGSLTPVSGITVQARLIDVRTGLIVQTGKIIAGNQDELIKKLPQLARMLALNDEDREALEEQLNQNAEEVEAAKPVPVEELPPLPQPPVPENLPEPPPPVIPARVKPIKPPEWKPADFQQIPPPPPPGQQFAAPVLIVEREVVYRRRMLTCAVELGDYHYRSGRIRHAHFHYQLAVGCAPEAQVVRERVIVCEPLLPPPAVVIVPPRPRLAVLDFVVMGNPRVVPHWQGAWAPRELAGYFAPNYEIVDRNEMYWWMSRLGITPQDLLHDPTARVYLGRALNVQSFLMGSLVETTSYDANTYLLNAEYGYLMGAGRINVRNPHELKLRMAELAFLTKASPAERLQIDREQAAWNLAVVDIRQRYERREYGLVINLGRDALNRRPGNVEVLFFLRQAEEQQRLADLAAARQREWLVQQEMTRRHQERHLILARQAELARIQAERNAAAMAAGDRARILAQREQAHGQMVIQAQFAFKQKRFATSISLYESALAFRSDEVLVRELAQARTLAAETARADAATAHAAREARLREQREAELVRARAALETERKLREVEDRSRFKQQKDRDDREYARLMDDAQQFAAKQQYDLAVATAQRAKRLRATPEADRMVSSLLIEQARAQAEKKGAKEKAALEQQLEAERERRVSAEAEAVRTRTMYEQLVQQGNGLLNEQKYDQAVEKLTAAAKLQRTDVVLVALKKAEDGQLRARNQSEVARKAKLEEARRTARVEQLLEAGKSALAAKQYEKAIDSYKQVLQFAPGNVDAVGGRAKAEQAREAELVAARRLGDDKQKRESFQRLLDESKTALAAKKYDDASAAVERALRILPGDKDALAARAEVKAAMVRAAQETSRRNAELTALLNRAETALTAGQFDAATTALQAAVKLDADNPKIAALQRRLKTAQDAREATMAAAKKKEQQFDGLVSKGRAALNQKQYEEAKEAFAQALTLKDDATVKQFLAQANKGLESMGVDAKVRRLAGEARTAIAKKQFVAADRAIASAAEAAPNHPEVVKLKEELRTARGAMTEAADRLRQKEYQDAMNSARLAFQSKRYEAAEKAVAFALTKLPGDKAATTLQQQIEAAMKNVPSPGDDAETKRKIAAYRAAMDAAQEAFEKKQYDAAEQAVARALTNLPNDKAATTLQQRIAAAKKAMDAGEAESKRKQALYRAAIDAAQTALAKRQFDEAQKSVAQALTLFPGDKAATTLQQQIAAERNKVMQGQQRKEEFDRFTTKARADLKLQKFDDAATAIKSALALFPNDRDAQALQQQIATARDQAMAGQQKKQDFDRFMAQARAALKVKRLAEATTAVDSALKFFPNDPDAQALKKQLAAPPPPDPRKQDFDRFMAQARTALTAKRIDDAQAAIAQALKLFPNDRDAQALKQQIDATPMPNPRKAEFDRFMAQARAALKVKRLAEATTAVDSALKLFPNDPEAQALKKQLAAPPPPDPRKQDFDRFMAQARTALTAKRIDDAQAAIAQALKLFPNDRDAQALKQQIDATPMPNPRKAEFDKFVQQAQAAMTAKRYDDAIKFFTQALAIVPNDPVATRGLAEAKKLAPPPPPPPPPPAFVKQMQQGDALLKQQKFTEALNAFKAALTIVPNEPTAAKKQKFAQHLVDADRFSKGRKFPDAVRELEAALKLFEDRDVRALLDKARKAK